MPEQKPEITLPKDCEHRETWITAADKLSLTCPKCGSVWKPAPGTEGKLPGETICYTTEMNTFPPYVMVEV